MSADPRVAVTLGVNGIAHSVEVEPARTLASVLRDDLGLHGLKLSCEIGVCGACTVLVDGKPTSSCLSLMAELDGREVLTVEGIGAIPELQRLQEAFIEEGGFQCGYCTSGQLMAAAPLVLAGERLAPEDLRHHLLGNTCRCTGYYGILRAIDSVLSTRHEGKDLAV